MQMARKRSPNYPAISLPEAITRVQQIHEAEHQNPAEREVMAQHLGYSGLNGQSLKLLSALTKYGLLEKAGDGELRVSDRAIDILFPEGDQRQLAIEAAAHGPALFADLREKWPNRPPSDEALRAYLIRRQFAHAAIDDVTQTFRETFDLVTRESGEYDSLVKPPENDQMPPTQTITEPVQPSLAGSTMAPDIHRRVSLVDDHLEVSAVLTTVEDVEKLINALNAYKLLVQPVSEAFATEHTDDEEGREAEERDHKRHEEIDGDE